jgi:hypothetical protein
MYKSKRRSNLGFAPITAAVLLVGAGRFIAPDDEEVSAINETMTLDEAVLALTATPTQERSTLPLCELERAHFERPMASDWYSCTLAPGVFEGLPIGQLDVKDFMHVGGIAWQCELRRLHGASIELPGLHPSSPAYRLGWRAGDHLTGLGRIGESLIVNLERDGRRLLLVYEIE